MNARSFSIAPAVVSLDWPTRRAHTWPGRGPRAAAHSWEAALVAGQRLASVPPQPLMHGSDEAVHALHGRVDAADRALLQLGLPAEPPEETRAF
ncbi:jg2151 [Pararge aegeria aegeria]|uniref:Jg2151 protein n=1 Tax=Pararge aegeria aegeria TaxID=348720 RepID=A0A8S4QC81_9NEOP|nr:jg2151 [Pararge aegeria aegeria]